MAVVSGRMISNIHLAVIVDPQATNDYVVYGRCHFAPRVVIVR